MGKMSPAVMIILLILELGICCFARNSSFGCIERERNALLRFRASLEDRSNRLSSWNIKNKDCCGWQGVKCSKITGHVITLDLSYKLLDDYVQSQMPYYDSYREIDTIEGTRLQGKTLNSSLFELKYLTYLDLSWNNFQGSKIPSFLGSMKHLQHLNLSNSNFNGLVPPHLGNLSSLRALDLNGNFGLIVDDLRWAITLPSLGYLGMNTVDLSSTKDPLKVLNILPSLRILRLSQSQLSQAHLPHVCLNSTLLANLWYLDLSANSFYGEFPCFIQNMTTLNFLDLSDNNLASNLLAHDSEWISKFIWDKCHLKSLDLSQNHFSGNISGLFRNMSGCWSHDLESLSLSHNKFYGRIPSSLRKLLGLTKLDLSFNKLFGPIPSSLGNLRSLQVLDLSSNQLSGEIPTSLGELSNLESIDISFNSFGGTFSEAHFFKLSKLEDLSAESNMLRFEVGNDWMPPFQLKYLSIGSSKIGGQFPKWLQTQKSLLFLYLSNCSITGTLPKWLHSINLTGLDLSHNNLTGPMPNNIGHMMPLLEFLDLSRNLITGTIPDSLCELRFLETLDLSKNHLSGNLLDCRPNFQNLEVARFSFNELSGVIPNSIGGAYNLQWLHLNNNKFMGQLPSALKNCTVLEFLDVGGNSLSGKLPEWIGKGLPFLVVLILRNNNFNGTIPSAFCQLLELQVMDLANNKLIGNIPHCFGNLSSMIKHKFDEPYEARWEKESLSQVIKGLELEYTTNSHLVVNLDLSSNYLVGEIPSTLTALSTLIGLNLSHNYLRGEIPSKIGDLESLESLDLSSNYLFGNIPDSLSNLSSLSYLNVSNNNLSGQIPTGNQLQTLDNPSIYEGNPQLCGFPLPKKCPKDEARSIEKHEAGNEDSADKALFYGFIVAGFATGFWGLIGVLVFKIKWRQAYFRFIEVVAEKML